MQQRNPDDRRYGRRIFWLAVVVALVVAGYTAGWFWLAQKIETEVVAALTALKTRGIDAECANPTVRGYPFRIGLYCDRTAFAQSAKAVSISTGAFRSAGQIYDPMRLVAELDSPVQVSAPGAGAISLNWQALRASIRLSRPLPKRVSLDGAMLRIATGNGAQLIAADSFQAHMRPNEADLDVAARFAGLALDPSLVDGRAVPPLSGEADLSVKDGVKLIREGTRDLRGKSGIVRDLTLRLGQKGALKFTGPFSIDQDGVIDADLKVSLSEPLALSGELAQVFPEQEDKIRQGFAGLAFLGSKPSLPLRITRGTATLGFIPLGKLPPVR